jgi:hypothetical protein
MTGHINGFEHELHLYRSFFLSRVGVVIVDVFEANIAMQYH